MAGGRPRPGAAQRLVQHQDGTGGRLPRTLCSRRCLPTAVARGQVKRDCTWAIKSSQRQEDALPGPIQSRGPRHFRQRDGWPAGRARA
ncbi:MAG: hypothetical protein AB7F50_02820 [Fimbriimonadaceae bacterium]